jgi:SAM-dependent methyltransferase
MVRIGHPIHERLLDVSAPEADSVLLDIGCGDGPTLSRARKLWPYIRLVGVDVKESSLVQAAETLAAGGPGSILLQVGGESGLPLASQSVDRTICHNVLEYLAQPGRLIEEAARILRPGGTAVWSHVDFAGVIFKVANPVLNQKVIDAHATYVPIWMHHADGRMGRKLPGLVKRSPLRVDSIDVFTTVSDQLPGDAQWRIDQMLAVLRPAAEQGRIELTPGDLDRWVADLRDTAAAGDFFFAELAVVVVSSRLDQ